DVADALLSDSVGERVAREMSRAARARLYASAAAALCLVLCAVLVAWRAKTAEREFESHLTAAGSDSETTTRVAAQSGAPWAILVSTLCLLLAALLVGLFGVFR